MTGRIAGLLFSVGAPAYLGWEIGSDISDYFKFGQIAKIGTQGAVSVALPILYIKSLGHTTVDKFGDWGGAVGENIANVRNSLESLTSKYSRRA